MGTLPADHVVVVVAGFDLEQGTRTGRRHMAHQPHSGEGMNDVVDGLGRHGAQPLPDTGGDGLDVGVRLPDELGQHRHPRLGDPKPDAAKALLDAVHVPSILESVQIMSIQMSCIMQDLS